MFRDFLCIQFNTLMTKSYNKRHLTNNQIKITNMIFTLCIFFSAFLQKITGDGGLPYYFGTVIFCIAGLVLLPFSKAKHPETKEIEIVVTEKRIKPTNVSDDTLNNNYYIRDEHLFSDVFI